VHSSAQNITMHPGGKGENGRPYEALHASKRLGERRMSLQSIYEDVLVLRLLTRLFILDSLDIVQLL
jgi:hypothetical protein